MKMIALGLSAMLAAVSAASDRPFLSWWTKPSEKADSHLILTGGGWGKDIRLVSETGESVKPVAADDVYAVFPYVTSPSRAAEKWKVVGTGGETPLFAPDAPDIWWLQADDYDVATPGGWLRVFGRGLTGGKQASLLHTLSGGLLGEERGSSVTIVRDGVRRSLPLKVAEEWELWAEVPEDLAAGEYEVFVSNGRDGGEVAAGKWTFGAKRLPWKTKEFSVADFGATPNDDTDDTFAFRKAMAAAGANGGGTVTVPRGKFIVTRTVRIPEHVLLKGVSSDLSSVHMPDSPDPAGHLFIGTSNFGIHDLFISTGAYYAGIVAENDVCEKYDKPDRWAYCHDNRGKRDAVFSENISLKNLVVRFISDQLRDTEKHYQFMTRYDRPGTGIVIRRTRNSEMVNVDLHTDKNASWCLSHIFTGHNIRIAGCRFSGTGWHIMGGRHCIIEHNHSCYGTTCSVPPQPNGGLYFGHNLYEGIFTNNREGCTTDGGGGQFIKDVKVHGEVNGTHVKLKLAPGTKTYHRELEKFIGMNLEIFAGKGILQERTIVAAKSFTDFEIDRPFDVQPDETSLFCAMYQRHHSLFVHNRFQDCGCAICQFGLSRDARYINNSCSRSSGGYYAYGMQYHNAATCRFIEFIGNRIDCGIDLHAHGNGASIGTGRRADHLMPFSHGYLMRDNVVNGNGTITLAAKYVLAEGNEMHHSDIGLHCDYWQGTQVIGRNTFDDVDKWYVGLDPAVFLPCAPRRADLPDRYAAARKAGDFVRITNGWHWAKSTVPPRCEQAFLNFEKTGSLEKRGGFAEVPHSVNLKWEGPMPLTRDGRVDFASLDRSGKSSTNDVIVVETSFKLEKKTGITFRRDDSCTTMSVDGRETLFIKDHYGRKVTLELAAGTHTIRLTRTFHPNYYWMSDRNTVCVEAAFPDGDRDEALKGRPL